MSILEKTLRETLVEYEVHIPMSYQEYLTTFDEDVHAEWVQGEVIIFRSAATRHQVIVAYLIQLLRTYVEYFHLGQLFAAPYEMKVSPTGNAREPDILFVKTEHQHRIKEQRVVGVADLVIEVVSPESVKRDNEDKFREYEAAGVPEYWIIDPRPEQQTVEIWVLDKQGHYQAVPETQGVYKSSALPNFWLNPQWLWHPEEFSALAAFAQVANLPPEFIELLQRGGQV